MSSSSSSRTKWSEADNICLLFCHHRSRPGTAGVRKRLERLWEDAGYPHKSGAALAGQVRSIMNSSNMISDSKKLQIQSIVQSELSNPLSSGPLPLSIPSEHTDTFTDLTSPSSAAGLSAAVTSPTQFNTPQPTNTPIPNTSSSPDPNPPPPSQSPPSAPPPPQSSPPPQSPPPSSSQSPSPSTSQSPPPPQSLSTQATPSQAPSTQSTTGATQPSRITWSHDMITLLIQLHWQSEPNMRGLWNRVALKWNTSHHPSRTASQLSTQFRSITQSGRFSAQVLCEIRAAAEPTVPLDPQPPHDPQEPTRPVQQPHTRSTRSNRERNTQLTEAQIEAVKEELIELMNDPSSIKVKDLRHRRWKDIRDEIDRITPAIIRIPTPTLTSLNTLLLAVAHTVRDRIGEPPPRDADSDSSNANAKKVKAPLWKRRLDRSVLLLRKDLSRLTELSHGKRLKESTQAEINRRYPLLKCKGLPTIIEEVKQRLLAKSAKIKRYNKKSQTYRQNHLFETHQRNFYRSLGNPPDPAATQLAAEADPEEYTGFWGGIWGNEMGYNTDAEWLPAVQTEMNTVVPQPDFTIAVETVAARVKGMSNWTAPGIDGLHGFWLKHVCCLHTRLSTLISESILTGNIPTWLTEGRTFLIMKDPGKGFHDPSNFRPITCLPNIWKLTTGILADQIYTHLESNGLFPEEQKGCKRNSRGCKEQLLIDKLILRQAKRLQRSVHMSFIDYKKAYDSVPHSWILDSMSLCKIHPSIISFFRTSFSQCSVNLTLNGRDLGKVPIKRGLFQGDSVSPIHFIIALIPLSYLLSRSDAGYNVVLPSGGETVINHRLYMDDLKLYGSSAAELSTLLEVTAKFSSDINMEFGLSKCGTVHVVNGRRAILDGITLPDGSVLPEVEEGGYRYLGILETDTILNKRMKEITSTEYFRRIKLLLKSSLTSRNLITAINSWAVPVIRYGAGILSWTVTEKVGLDTQTRKLLRISGALHIQSDVDRLYVSRKRGGRGLQRMEDVIVREEVALASFFNDTTDFKLQSLFSAMNIEGMLLRDPEDGEVLKLQHENRLIDKWKDKPVHGRFLQQLEEGGCSPNETWSWLLKQSIPKNTEAMIFAAQDQALRTNWYRAIIAKNPDTSPLCRICREHNESVEHILNHCQKLANSEYKQRHDRVAAAIHWGMCIDSGFEISTSWFLHYAEKVLENDRYKILWDFLIQCDRTIQACKPDLVLVDKRNKEAIIVDVAVPKDRLVADREVEKVQKYQELRREIQRIWGLSKVSVVPIVIGALGGVTDKLPEYLSRLTKRISLSQLQKTVLFSSSNILRTILDM